MNTTTFNVLVLKSEHGWHVKRPGLPVTLCGRYVPWHGVQITRTTREDWSRLSDSVCCLDCDAALVLEEKGQS